MLLEKKRIFYIEDDVKNRSIAQIILEQAGAKFGFERWGEADALVRLKAFLPIDLILLDLRFPCNVTGYDVFSMIRGDPALATIPIVAVTASDPAVELSKVRSYGFDGFISKPIDLRSFPQQVDAAINGKQIWSTD